jgi:PilZ domain
MPEKLEKIDKLEKVEKIDKVEQHQDRRTGSSPDLRANPRYPFSTRAEAIDLAGNTRIIGRISDIALHGCYIDTICPFAPQATVALKIIKDNQSFETKATVVYSQIGMGMGLSFMTTDIDQVHLLKAWLAELGGEKNHEPESAAPVPQFEPPMVVDQSSRSCLNEIILLLMHKRVLTATEGNAILQRLFR